MKTLMLLGFGLLGVACTETSSKGTTGSSGVGATSLDGSADLGEGGESVYGTLDDTQLGATCAPAECPANQYCVKYWGLTPEQSNARCVKTENPCELISCVPGRKCSIATSDPPQVGCLPDGSGG